MKNDRHRNMERMEIIPLVPYGTLTILSVLPADDIQAICSHPLDYTIGFIVFKVRLNIKFLEISLDHSTLFR